MRAIGLATLALLTAVWPQAPRPDTIVSGRVVHAATGAPLSGAVVRLGEAPAASAAAAFLTGGDGRFILRNVPPGRITVTASKTGYLTGHPTASLSVPPGGELTGIVVPLTPTALIAGRVLTPNGDPVAYAAVRAVLRGGSSSSRATRSTTADERGAFVIDGLAAGDYVVGAAQSQPGALRIPEQDTVLVAVGAGEDRPGIDLRIAVQSAALESLTVAARGSRGRSGAPRGAGSIAGTVRSAAGRPIAQLMVVAFLLDERAPGAGQSGEPLGQWGSTSDERGAFTIENLPAGSYVVGAGWSPRFAFASGGTRPNVIGAPLPLAAGERKRDIAIVLPEPAVISGTIRDEFGDPVRATVTVFSAAPALVRGPPLRRTTDDRGRYRFGALPSGAYLVMAERARSAPRLLAGDGSGGERAVGPTAVFYPSVPSFDLASVLSVDAGAELQGIDVTAAYVPVSPVQVSVVEPAGQPLGPLTAHLTPAGGAAPAIGEPRSMEQPVTFDAVPAGLWTFVASAPGAAPVEKYWASHELATDGVNAVAATVMLEPGAQVSGRMTFDGEGAQPRTVQVFLVRVDASGQFVPDPGNPRVNVGPTGAFRVTGVMPGRYAVGTSVGPDGGWWMLARATLRGADVLDLPLDLPAGRELTDLVLTLSDRVTELSGTATDAAGRPAADTALVVVPADARYHWPGSRRTQHVVTGPDGTYVIRGLPPGEYLIGLPPTATLGGALLLQPGDLTPAARVTIAPGERKVQDVRLR